MSTCRRYLGVALPELKLSESRRHARRYGRLGIGFKRPFLFRRAGRPLVYVGFRDGNDDRFFQACSKELTDRRMLNFFKPMNEQEGALSYELYAESEWRILAFESLVGDVIVDPRKARDTSTRKFFQSLESDARERLRFLIPLDGWIQMIIFPSIEAKDQAQQDNTIRGLIRAIKERRPDHGNSVEHGNWPIELDLDACMHL